MTTKSQPLSNEISCTPERRVQTDFVKYLILLRCPSKFSGHTLPLITKIIIIQSCLVVCTVNPTNMRRQCFVCMLPIPESFFGEDIMTKVCTTSLLLKKKEIETK